MFSLDLKKMEVLIMNYDTDYPCKGAKSTCKSDKINMLIWPSLDTKN